MKPFSIIKRTLAAVVATVGLGSVAMAQVPVQGQVTADNFFVVNLTYGPNQTTTLAASTNTNTAGDAQWQNPSAYNFTIDENRLGHCFIQVVAWNSGANTPAAIAASFTGNLGTERTGGTAYRVYDTTVPAATFGATPSTAPIQVMESWVRLTDDMPSDLSYFSAGVWAAANLPANTNWVWSDGADQTVQPGEDQNSNFRSLTLPCASIVGQPSIPTFAELDHFQCYEPREVEGEVKAEEIYVKDQFGEGRIVLATPVLHCNPSAKIHNDREFDIQNEEDHLVCYKIEKQEKMEGKRVQVRNQFGELQYSLRERLYFCAPSDKREL